MGQERHSAPAPPSSRGRSGTLLVSMGLLWLLLAAILLTYQLTDTASVEITWETATEQQTVGFNVYRSNKPDEGFVLINNAQLIESEGGPVSGANYTFIDKDVKAGRTYYYILEEVELDGGKNQYTDEVLEYSVPNITWWAIVLSFCSAIAGVAMLILGLKEKKK